MSDRSGPHVRIQKNAPKIYMDVMIALLPCCVAAVYCYGLRALILLLWGPLLHILTDHFFARFVRREQVYLDLSGGVSGLILVLLLPPTVSVWAVSAGILFSSVIVKQFFGGVGCNLFNPAFAGRAFMAIAFAGTTETLVQPLTGFFRWNTLFFGPGEMISVAPETSEWLEILSGIYPGAMGLTGILFAVAGAVYLTIRGILRLQAPLAYFGTIVTGYWVFFLKDASINGLLSLIATSGIFFCAAFAFGDFTTIPSSATGRVVFGIGTGVLAMILISCGHTILAVVSPVLLMNGVTPLLEFYIRPRVFAKGNWYSRKGLPDSIATIPKGETEVRT